MSIDNQSGPEADKLQELEQLLAREQEPSPLARARFLAALQQEAQHQMQTNGNPVIGFFRSLWPARPVWGFGYSAALLVLGLFAGQLLPPHSFGMGPQVTASAARAVELCLVPPPQVECAAGQDKC